MAFALLPNTVTIEDNTKARVWPVGEVMAAGNIVRKTTANVLMISDSELAAEDDVYGVALADANGVGQLIPVAPIGSVVVVSGLTAGQTYYLGGAGDQGEVGLFADAVLGTHFATVVGVALSATRLLILGIKTDVQL